MSPGYASTSPPSTDCFTVWWMKMARRRMERPMEKKGGGDQRYWSANAATLNGSRKYLQKFGSLNEVTQIISGSSSYLTESQISLRIHLR